MDGNTRKEILKFYRRLLIEAVQPSDIVVGGENDGRLASGDGTSHPLLAFHRACHEFVLAMRKLDQGDALKAEDADAARTEAEANFTVIDKFLTDYGMSPSVEQGDRQEFARSLGAALECHDASFAAPYVPLDPKQSGDLLY